MFPPLGTVKQIGPILSMKSSENGLASPNSAENGLTSPNLAKKLDQRVSGG